MSVVEAILSMYLVTELTQSLQYMYSGTGVK